MFDKPSRVFVSLGALVVVFLVANMIAAANSSYDHETLANRAGIVLLPALGVSVLALIVYAGVYTVRRIRGH